MFILRLMAFTCLVSTGCAPTLRSICETKCGLSMAGYNPGTMTADGGIIEGTMPEGWTCQDLQSAEDEAQERFKLTSEPRLNGKQGDMCKNVRGFTITVHPATSWVSKAGDGIYGQTFCLYSTIEIGNSKVLKQTALYHELVHAAQKCNPSQPPDRGEDEDHADWVRNGIRAALGDLERQSFP